MIATPSLESLNAEFGAADAVRFEPGEGGLPRAVLTGQGGEAHVYLLGAHVTHYQPAQHEPVLWMSRSSQFRAGAPIRGGVPICLPWFAVREDRPDLPNHGFARTTTWHVAGAEKSSQGDAAITLSMTDDPQTRRLWPHAFEFRMTITVGTALNMALSVTNRDDKTMAVTQALHSYLNVGDVRRVRITGLQGVPYFSKVEGGTHASDDPIEFTAETDRVYNQTRHTCELHDPVLGRRLVVEKTGSNSTVVWNPWVDKSKAMPDFGDDEWPGMVCIETANALTDALSIAPGDSHTMSTAIHSLR